MEIAKQIAGFSGPEADDLRKAIGKKNREKMASLKQRFFDGANQTGTHQAVVAELWAVNESAADYSFNKSHAACYALISYRTAWLKANYPAEYMAALISSVMSTKDKVPFFVSRCEEMGIEVLPPDVNESGHDFVVSAGNIRFGLDAVKNVGSQAVEAILSARNDGDRFGSIWDFCERVDARAVNRKAIESLIKCGALDSTGNGRQAMLDVLGQAQAAGQKYQQDSQLGQVSIFDLDAGASGGGASSGASFGRQFPPLPAVADDRHQLNAWEKETLGLFLSSHPVKELRPALRAKVQCSLAELENQADGSWVSVGGMIAESKRVRTRKGDQMLFATLDDLEGQVEMLVFNSVYEQDSDKLEDDTVVLVRGRLDHKDQGDTKLVAQEIEHFQPSEQELEHARNQPQNGSGAPSPQRSITLHIDGGVPESFVEELRDVVNNFPGDCELLLRVGKRSLRLGPDHRVSGSNACRSDLTSLPGAPVLSG
jgi:DNA polymerase-3 subunit alpha